MPKLSEKGTETTSFDGEQKDAMPKQRAYWVAFCSLLIRRIHGLQLLQVAASLTFTTVLALVPLMTVALAIFTAFPMFDRMQGELQGYLFENFFPENISATIFKYVNLFSTKAKGLTAVGVVFLVVTSLTTMFTVDRVFNQIWNVKRPRSLVNKVLLYWAVISFSPLLIGFSLSLSSRAIGHSLKVLDFNQGGFLTVLELVSFVITVSAFAFLYRIIPNRDVHWKDALLGGVLAAVLFEVSKRAFAAYIVHFPSYTALYGALAAFPIFLLWLYVSWIIVLLGAILAAALPSVRSKTWGKFEKPGMQWLMALGVLKALEKARTQITPGLGVSELSVQSRVPIDVLDEVLGLLMTHNVVGLLANVQGGERFVLIGDLDRMPASVLAEAVWFDLNVIMDWKDDLPVCYQRLQRLHREFFEKTSVSTWIFTD